MNSSASISASLQSASTDYGPPLSIISWLLLVISTLIIIARLATKWAVAKKFGSDDALALLSLVGIWRMTFGDRVILATELDQIFNIGAGLAVSVAAMNGLGRDLTSLSDPQLAAVQKVSSQTQNFQGKLLIVTEYLR